MVYTYTRHTQTVIKYFKLAPQTIMKNIYFKFIAIAIISVVSAITGCSSIATSNKTFSNEQLFDIENTFNMHEGAIWIITPKGWPETYENWGQENTNKINKIIVAIAILASKSSTCDQVTHASYSPEKSITNKLISTYAKCRNNQRFELSEKIK